MDLIPASRGVRLLQVARPMMGLWVMRHWIRLLGFLLLTMGIVGTAVSQPFRFPNPKAAKTGREQPGKTVAKPSAGPATSSGEKTPPPAASTVETLKLPSGAVIVISG